MAGSREQGLKACATNKSKYGPDFYRKIGGIAGRKRRPETRTFYVNRELASRAGAKGGRISRRPKRSSTN